MWEEVRLKKQVALWSGVGICALAEDVQVTREDDVGIDVVGKNKLQYDLGQCICARCRCTPGNKGR